MNTEENIFIGIFSGIITSALIFLVLQIFNKVILPWYRHAIYRGLDISGGWEARQIHEKYEDYLLFNLEQREQDIKGTLTVIKTNTNNSEEREIKTLNIVGRFQDGHLMLTGNNIDRRFRSHLTYLANVQNGGNVLHGIYTFVDAGHGRISCQETQISRKKG